MKTRYLVVVVMLAGLLAGTVQAAAPIGEVVALQGKAEAVGADGQARALAVKGQVFLNDKIRTEAGSKIQVLLDDDSVIAQGEKSEMVIDQYVYSPKEKDAGCGIKLAKGLFRVVTGKITEMNPDRFQVKTRKATIGIRGCELGFEVGDEGERIYIVRLPAGKSIFIESGLPGGLFGGQRRSSTTVQDSGRLVTVSDDGTLHERPLRAEETQGLVDASTPEDSDGEGGGDAPEGEGGQEGEGGDGEGDGKKDGEGQKQEGDGQEGADAGQQGEGEGEAAAGDGEGQAEGDGQTAEAEQPAAETGQEDGGGADQTADAEPTGDGAAPTAEEPAAEPAGEPAGGEPPVAAEAPATDPVAPAEPDPNVQPDGGGGGEGGDLPLAQVAPQPAEEDPWTPPPVPEAPAEPIAPQTYEPKVDPTTWQPPDPPPPPPPPPPPFVPRDLPRRYFPDAGLQGTDWQWGAWQDEREVALGQVVPTAEGLYVREMNGVRVPPNMSDLVAGSVQYYMSGSGVAAAYLQFAGAAQLLRGTCDMDVTVGGGPSTWGGQFRMTGPSAELNFDASGSVERNGSLTPNDWYLLRFNVNNASYNNIREYDRELNGHLIGSGQAPDPISGAIGTYRLVHQGSGPQAHGVFGTDLQRRNASN